MIVDCTLGFNELDLFRIRYHELADLVDLFVIVEATHTHSGIPKPLYFSEWYESLYAAQMENIADPLDSSIDLSKIDIIVWDNAYGGDTSNGMAWHREHNHREVIGQYLQQNRAPDDIIMLSDMDEIPRGDALDTFLIRDGFLYTPRGLYRFEQDLTYLYFNTYAGKWCGTKLFRLGDIDFTQHMPITTQVRYRKDEDIAGTIAEGGWHFSSCGGADKVRLKFDSYAHTEMQLKSRADIEDSLARVVDPFHKTPLEVRTVDFLPQYVKENMHYFNHYIYTGNS
jgi:Glycosyltransferase family 17